MRVIVSFAYLLFFRGGLQDVIHQNRHEFCHSVDASGIGSIRGRAVNCLCLCLGLLEPFPGYRVYDVEYPQLVCSRCLFEVCEDFLDEDGFGLLGQAVSGCLALKQLEMFGSALPGCWKRKERLNW